MKRKLWLRIFAIIAVILFSCAFIFGIVFMAVTGSKSTTASADVDYDKDYSSEMQQLVLGRYNSYNAVLAPVNDKTSVLGSSSSAIFPGLYQLEDTLDFSMFFAEGLPTSYNFFLQFPLLASNRVVSFLRFDIGIYATHSRTQLSFICMNISTDINDFNSFGLCSSSELVIIYNGSTGYSSAYPSYRLLAVNCIVNLPKVVCDWFLSNTTLINVTSSGGGNIEESYREGYEAGKTDGYNEGYSTGKNDGLSIGREEGYEEGFQDGEDHGKEIASDPVSDIYQNTFNRGKDEGYKEGYAIGLNKGQSDSLTNPASFFLEPVHTFLSTELFGSFSLGDAFNVVLFVAVAVIFIKMFAGG